MEFTPIDIKKTARNIVDEITRNLLAQKASGIKNCYTIHFDNYRTLASCVFKVGKFELALNDTQFRDLSHELLLQLGKLRKTRGWSNLSWECVDINFSRSWYSDYQSIIQSVTLLADPCKEFVSLANYMFKYCGKKIALTDLYSVCIGGKRGRVYGEEGCRYYLAHRPKTCAKLLEELRKARGSKDIVTTSAFKQVDDIDEWELECSIRNEVEFSGCRYNLCEVTIKTPSGKVKKVISIKA